MKFTTTRPLSWNKELRSLLYLMIAVLSITILVYGLNEFFWGILPLSILLLSVYLMNQCGKTWSTLPPGHCIYNKNTGEISSSIPAALRQQIWFRKDPLLVTSMPKLRSTLTRSLHCLGPNTSSDGTLQGFTIQTEFVYWPEVMTLSDLCKFKEVWDKFLSRIQMRLVTGVLSEASVSTSATSLKNVKDEFSDHIGTVESSENRWMLNWISMNWIKILKHNLNTQDGRVFNEQFEIFCGVIAEDPHEWFYAF